MIKRTYKCRFLRNSCLCFSLAAQPSAPTPLLQASGMCIKPQRGKCQPPDGTILVLTKTKPCDQPFMQFTLSADGTLKHHCSGKMVCPRKPAQGKRCELMISSKCQPQDAKFERTAGMISKFARRFVLKLEFIIIIAYHPRGSIGRPTVPSKTRVSFSLPLLSPRSCPLIQLLQHEPLPVIPWPSICPLSKLVFRQFFLSMWPIQRHFLRITYVYIVSILVLLSTSSLLITFGHRALMLPSFSEVKLSGQD